jgi:hypothetical protein
MLHLVLARAVDQNSGTLEGFPNPPAMVRGEQSSPAPHARNSSFFAIIAGTFLFGWLLGVAIVFKLWHLAHAPRWMLMSGVGYVTLMLPPTITGFTLAWATGRLAARGWGPVSLGLAGAGVVGLVAGLLAV